eukprot:TRINITY_DN8610_c0_g1_i2.p1 TRINITY_DN8610_c0_g1~~TRINITY_DN8610_c0_g1_i2.p1  ORF type:complete len:699 (+),score=144.84 TRINITY_DN8610_c0_g1_i2:204-2099(+)
MKDEFLKELDFVSQEKNQITQEMNGVLQENQLLRQDSGKSLSSDLSRLSLSSSGSSFGINPLNRSASGNFHDPSKTPLDISRQTSGDIQVEDLPRYASELKDQPGVKVFEIVKAKRVRNKMPVSSLHSRFLMVDMREDKILLCKGHFGNGVTGEGIKEYKKVSRREVRRMEKSISAPSLLTIEWAQHRPAQYIFKNPLEREQFYNDIQSLHRHVHVPSRHLSIHLATWNMGNLHPPPALAPWIPADQHDIYAISVQECYSLGEEEWCAHLAAAVGTGYDRVSDCSLWGIRLVIFIRHSLSQDVHNLQRNSCATGVGSVAGNKGAVAISFKIRDTSLCFVNSHLAPHFERNFQRNAMFNDICKSLQLGIPGLDILHQFDHLLWAGDLNYRIDLSREAVLDHVDKKEWDILLQHDQLKQSQHLDAAFQHFAEGPLLFPPTFKLLGDGSYSFKRVPAYCDRVLWKSQENSSGDLQQKSYMCIPSLRSDHVAVCSSFALNVREEPFFDPNTDLPFIHLLLENVVVTQDVASPSLTINFASNFSPMVSVTAVSPFRVEVPTFIKSMAHLEKLTLLFSLWDDYSGKFHGEGAISLRRISQGPIFQVAISKRGSPWGQLSGHLSVHESTEHALLRSQH